MKKRKPVRLVAILKQRSGMSIVNVMVAFVVLLLVVAAFVSVVRLSQNLIRKADRTRENAYRTQRSFYLGELPAQQLAPEAEYTLTDGTDSFTLPVSAFAYAGGSCTFYMFGEQEGAQ